MQFQIPSRMDGTRGRLEVGNDWMKINACLLLFVLERLKAKDKFGVVRRWKDRE